MAKAANPFMHYVADYEKEAEAFLTKYECADAIDNPRPIPIRDIATRLMSLEIIDTEYLSFDGSVQGAIAFTKGIIEVYDWSAEETIGYEVSQPSIFVDADIMNIGRFNNTLAHECFHWWRHRNYFNYKRNHENGTEFAFRCNRGISTTGSLIGGQWSDIDKMEWQAKTIAPKILMPRTAFKKKVDHIYQVLLADNPNADRSIVTEYVIDNVADFFEVSRQSAAIRMYELGYGEAEAYCAGESNAPASQIQHRKATQAKRHQRPISPLDAFTVRHAYYREYHALQRLCLLILRHQKHQIGTGTRQIYGILFDGAWLWEEYINSLIDDVFYHPMNKGGKGAQRLFEGNVGLIYPDFISRNSEKRVIADAKYKPIDNIGNRDYLQVLAYMFRFDAQTGYYLYPEAENSEGLRLRMNRGSTYEANVIPREDISITKHGLKIPMDATDYAGFVSMMKVSEQEFMSAFC